MIRRQNQHAPDSSCQCPWETGFLQDFCQVGKEQPASTLPLTLHLKKSHWCWENLHSTRFCFFFCKNQSVLSFKTCWWSELTKKTKVTIRAGSPKIQADRWAEEEKDVKNWTFQILSAHVPLMKCNFSCSMLPCPSCITSAVHPPQQNIKASKKLLFFFIFKDRSKKRNTAMQCCYVMLRE